ncbi:hypothetical protein AN958_12913 [Leucoagaricus sp. SymC.cos]|nr:hypothetical protein AN958_12913 [Leucoagaricus sp. SymC.cos]
MNYPGYSRDHSNFFQGASQFLLNNVTMMDRPTIVNSTEGTVLQTLEQEMVPGVDIDSSERYPPPRCHPGTRAPLTTQIVDWLEDDHREHDIFWLHGPAGVGKSAVAQSIAEHANENGQLGAAFFFSRTNNRNDYQRVWITIAYQLGVRVPGYLSLLASQLAADPNVLCRTPQTQFQRLIVGPMSSLPVLTQRKFLVVFDGVDECRGEEAQLNLIELISDLVASNHSFPILWMIFTRPEPRFNRFLNGIVFHSRCWVEEVDLDSDHSMEDVAIFLRAGFREIQRKYSDSVDESWPPEQHIVLVIEKASGLFVIASTILRYVGDPLYGDPDTRLDEAICHLSSWNLTKGSHPTTATLDLLYTQILSEVPSNILPTTLLILRTSWTNVWSYPAVVLANLHKISRSTFYSALRKLHSVVDVPSPQDAATLPLRIMHQSFEDYLQDPGRCGVFYISEHTIAAILFKNSFSLALSTTLGAATADPPSQIRAMTMSVDVPLSWPLSDASATEAVKFKIVYLSSSSIIWPVHFKHHDEEVCKVIQNFDFNTLVACQAVAEDEVNPERNGNFCEWLLSSARI